MVTFCLFDDRNCWTCGGGRTSYNSSDTRTSSCINSTTIPCSRSLYRRASPLSRPRILTYAHRHWRSDVIPCGLLILSLFVTLKVLRFNLGKIKPMKVLDFLPQSFELRKYLKLIWQHRYQMQNVTSRHPLLSFQNRSLKYTIYDQLSH